MSFINPIWLWGLSVLAIPVAIHLLSRKDGPVIRVGSIRFLTETSTSKFSSIRLNEIALLAVRSLLIVCVVLFLAGSLWPAVVSQDSKKWVIVETGLEKNRQLKPVLDSLKKDGYEFRTLAGGFPLTTSDTSHHADYFRLTEDLAKEPVAAVVFAVNKLHNFRGKRIDLPTHVRWIMWPEEAADTDQAYASQNLTPVRVTVAYEPEFTHDKKIIVAALNAIESVLPGKLTIREMPVENFSPTDSSVYLIWLSDKNVSYLGRQLRFQQDDVAKLIEQQSPDQWMLTKRLTEDNALEEHLAIGLLDVLFDDQHLLRTTAANDLSVPNELVWSKANATAQTVTAEAGISLDKFLLIAAAVLFLAERLLAFYRKQ